MGRAYIKFYYVIKFTVFLMYHGDRTQLIMQLLTHLVPEDLDNRLAIGWGPVDGSYPRTILTTPEQDEWSSFADAGRRREYVATRAVLRRLVETMDLEANRFRLLKDELGKPYGRYRDRHYHLSIAHTKARVLCAVSADLELGVDMEPAGRRVPERLRRRILAPAEMELLSDEPTIRIWTLKEALVKLQGQGMRTNLNECAITGKEGRDYTAILHNEKRAKICSFQHKQNWLAIAWNH